MSMVLFIIWIAHKNPQTNTYRICNFYLIQLLECLPIKEKKLPAATTFLNRGACDKYFIIWAETTIRPVEENKSSYWANQ